MCGIIAVLLADPSAAVNQEIYDGLTSLQHRGQDAAGTCNVYIMLVGLDGSEVGLGWGKGGSRWALVSPASAGHAPLVVLADRECSQ